MKINGQLNGNLKKKFSRVHRERKNKKMMFLALEINFVINKIIINEQ